ncbi:iron-sulfur cluster carrier protein ApbC [Proteobacteria bacterium 005FR1]|nr:iron-sulfur cluster carrier protein ApbC [Proteobacteria bacterium 005FR1]
MPDLNVDSIRKALQDLRDPVLQQSLLELDALDIEVNGKVATVTATLGYPCAGVRAELEQALKQRLLVTEGVDEANVSVLANIPDSGAQKRESIAKVKNIIAVASGKGGVGKSTTAVNLALALSVEGAKVGLLDADIYGPSQPQMLGVGGQKPKVIDNRYMLPIEAHGLKANSMGFLVTEQTPMVWRGPMVSSAFQQLVNQTDWGDLDYLVIDMPPGTGDIQLTLSQSVPVTGAVIVTTPQDIALLDAKKGIEMFRKVNVPVLGVIENMATHICSNCGFEEHIFGSGGGERIAAQYHTPLLGSLPLDLSIREQADGGHPSVIADPESPVSRVYRQIARHTGAQLWLANRSAAAPEISISDD